MIACVIVLLCVGLFVFCVSECLCCCFVVLLCCRVVVLLVFMFCGEAYCFVLFCFVCLNDC